MKKPTFLFLALAIVACACNNTSKPQTATGQTDQQVTDTTTAAVNNAEAQAAPEFPPLMAFCVKGQPLFVPFNDGDIPGEGKDLKQSPQTYTTFIMGDEAFDVTFKEEKNKQLKEDESCINQYLYQSVMNMKGMVFNFADNKAVEKYLNTHGDMLPEGDIIPMEFNDGILVTTDFLKSHSLLKYMATTTEDPDGPTFPEKVVKQVEKIIGTKVAKNRISTIFGKEEYQFGVMTTEKKGNYALGMYVLAKGADVSLCVDTLKADETDGSIDWSMADPDNYQEPKISVVLKGENGLEIFCSVPDAETQNFLWLKQEADKLKSQSLGNFPLRYE